MGNILQYGFCKTCGGMFGRQFQKEVFNDCKCVKKMKIGIDKRAYIHPKEMEFISYVLNSRYEFDEDQIKWYESKVQTRISVLQPLIRQCIDKDLPLEMVSRDLNKEYVDLIFLKNKHDL